ncbi:hypothetical protein SBRY_30236 [Actinacidiphila bryophytorum]|uniref:Uncharacterized protein n=1 Tax=Actinacidiphila bryophytorum TaxID=1436133 RepID=A0A9W4H0N4_9ACTN|nr:hypothetical protein SBRY_30236 [Actinacidiphila bryophytorum]
MEAVPAPPAARSGPAVLVGEGPGNPAVDDRQLLVAGAWGLGLGRHGRSLAPRLRPGAVMAPRVVGAWAYAE